MAGMKPVSSAQLRAITLLRWRLVVNSLRSVRGQLNLISRFLGGLLVLGMGVMGGAGLFIAGYWTTAHDPRWLAFQCRVGARRATRAAVGVSRQQVDRARLARVACVRRAAEWRFACGAGGVPPVVRPRLYEAFGTCAVAHFEAVVMAAGAREHS